MARTTVEKNFLCTHIRTFASRCSSQNVPASVSELSCSAKAVESASEPPSVERELAGGGGDTSIWCEGALGAVDDEGVPSCCEVLADAFLDFLCFFPVLNTSTLARFLIAPARLSPSSLESASGPRVVVSSWCRFFPLFFCVRRCRRRSASRDRLELSGAGAPTPDLRHFVQSDLQVCNSGHTAPGRSAHMLLQLLFQLQRR